MKTKKMTTDPVAYFGEEFMNEMKKRGLWMRPINRSGMWPMDAPKWEIAQL